MAVTFVEERKKQKKLILVFILLIMATIFVLILGFGKKILPGGIIQTEMVMPTLKKIEIDWSILESQKLKDLEPFEKIKPFEEKPGRENPFKPY